MEKVGIEIELMGAEEAHRLLQNLDKDIDRLNKRKAFKSLSGLNKSKAELESYVKELERLQKAQERYKKMGKTFMASEMGKQAEETATKIRDMAKAYDEVTRKQKTFMQTAKSMTSHVAHVGSAMQSLGNALTRLTSPFSRIATGFLFGAGYKALNLFTEGLSNSFERADTMKNYDRTLRALGLDVEKTFSVAGKEAKTAKENLDDAVQGLPTSLDEIMAAQKVYAGATGEMVNSTKTAIAANNTVLASGMGDREARFMQRYLVALGSGADLTTMQWQSMARIAPLAMRAVSKELGYADKDYKQFTKDVQSGTVSGQEFLKAFQKVGTSGVVADAARAQTESWNGLFSNIRIAVTRLGANVLDTLNETFKDATGRTLLQQLLGWDADGKDLGDGIKGWINGMSESIQNWIRANPDKIIDFFNDLKSINVKGFLKGMAKSIGEIAEIVRFLAKLFDGKGMEFFGKAMPWLSLAGKALTIVGGFLKGTRHIWGWLGAGLLKLGGKIGGKLGGIGIFGKIASIFGKKKAIKTAGEAAGEVPTVASTFRKAFKSLEGLIKAAGAVLIVGTTGMIAFKEVKEMLKDVKEIGDIFKELSWINLGEVAGITVVIGAMAKGLEAIGEAMGKDGLLNEAIGGLAAVLAGGTLWGLTAEIKGMFDQIKATIDTFMLIANELSGFKAPEIDLKGILKTARQVNAIYRVLSGESPKRKGTLGTAFEMASRALGFTKNPLLAFGGSVAKGAQKSVDATSMATKYQALLDSIKNLKSIVTELNGLASVQVSDQAVTAAEDIAEAVSTVISKVSTWTKKIKGPKNLVTNTENYATAFKQMKTMATRINEMAGTTVNTSGFAEFISQLKDALESLKDIQGDLELDITVKLSKGFDESVTKVIDKIKKAKEKIKKQKKGVSFTIPVRVTFSVSTNLGSALATIAGAVSKINEARQRAEKAGGGRPQTPVIKSTGGMIYRAKGGNVPFKRMGTDTVPAMLTPGEYVHNKRAVNTFGIDFMRKVNNLDVKGAMNELMHRAGGMANVNRGTVITNNTYNNQKVNITNNGNPSAGFTFKSASRFVGAF